MEWYYQLEKCSLTTLNLLIRELYLQQITNPLGTNRTQISKAEEYESW
jgi:hypothetical protein